jgi:hypothetical protein
MVIIWMVKSETAHGVLDGIVHRSVLQNFLHTLHKYCLEIHLSSKTFTMFSDPTFTKHAVTLQHFVQLWYRNLCKFDK